MSPAEAPQAVSAFVEILSAERQSLQPGVRGHEILCWRVEQDAFAVAIIEHRSEGPAILAAAGSTRTPTDLSAIWWFAKGFLRPQALPFIAGNGFTYDTGSNNEMNSGIIVPLFGDVRVGDGDAGPVGLVLGRDPVAQFTLVPDVGRRALWIAEPSWEEWTPLWPTLVRSHAPFELPDIPDERPDWIAINRGGGRFGGARRPGGPSPHIGRLLVRYPGGRVLIAESLETCPEIHDRYEDFASRLIQSEMLAAGEGVRAPLEARRTADGFYAWARVEGEPEPVG